MRRLVSFAIAVSIIFSIVLTAIPVNAANNLIAFSEEAMEDAAKTHAYYEGHGEKLADISNYDGDNAVIQIYQIVIDDHATGNGHTATSDWYTVNRYTGIGTNMQGNKFVLDLPLPLDAYDDFSDDELMLLAEARWKVQRNYMYSPGYTIDKKYTIKFTATGDGTMTYTQSIVDAVTDEVKSTKEFSNVKLTEGKLMVAEIGGNIETESIKLFVQNEKGKSIAEVDIDGSEKAVNNNYLIIILISAIVIICISGVIVFILLKRKDRKLKTHNE